MLHELDYVSLAASLEARDPYDQGKVNSLQAGLLGTIVAALDNGKSRAYDVEFVSEDGKSRCATLTEEQLVLVEAWQG